MDRRTQSGRSLRALYYLIPTWMLGTSVFMLVSGITKALHPISAQEGVVWSSLTALGVFGIVQSLYMFRRIVLSKQVARIISRIGRRDGNAPRPSQRAIALTVLYLTTMRKRLTLSCVLILFAGMASRFLRPPGSSELLLLFSVSVVLLFVGKLAVLAYRVHCGFYGTTPHEARVLVAYALHLAARSGFSDRNGNPIPAMLPETDPAPSGETGPVLEGWRAQEAGR